MAKSKLPGILSMVAIFVIASGCHRETAYHAMTPAVTDPARGTTVLAVYVPWFGDPQHIKVGYTTDDPAVLRRQIATSQDLYYCVRISADA
jgi:hypothetical protein